MDNNEVDDAYATASLWTWLGLIALSATSFWVQAVITEERCVTALFVMWCFLLCRAANDDDSHVLPVYCRFVPALNVIATHFRIPDDVAGATMMAAGASSPELFASVVALFVTHSSLGIGTIVGSEIFNQLLICAGSVYSGEEFIVATWIMMYDVVLSQWNHSLNALKWQLATNGCNWTSRSCCVRYFSTDWL